MSKHITLTLDEINQLSLDSFLKQEPEDAVEGDPDVAEGDHDEVEGGKLSLDKSEIYLCQNPTCQYADSRTYVHVYEIDDDNQVIICDQCYDQGFRFCLYTLDVLHQSQLEPVLGNMYAQPAINQHQLDFERLDQVSDFYQYLKMIGIDNHDPEHTIIELKPM